MTESQKKALRKYEASHTVQIHLKLNVNTDEDILVQLAKVAEEPGGKQGYIKRLIRQDIQ